MTDISGSPWARGVAFSSPGVMGVSGRGENPERRVLSLASRSEQDTFAANFIVSMLWPTLCYRPVYMRRQFYHDRHAFVDAFLKAKPGVTLRVAWG